MENKLTLADVSCYLPYGLEYIRETYGHVVTHHILSDAWDEHNMENGNGLVVPNSLPVGFKPLLRPMSMLYQTIVHEGKEEVPIVELAKLCHPDRKWKIGVMCAQTEDGDCTFDYKNGSFLYCSGHYISSHMQWKLFDWLASRFFDFRGLIGKGLAIKMDE